MAQTKRMALCSRRVSALGLPDFVCDAMRVVAGGMCHSHSCADSGNVMRHLALCRILFALGGSDAHHRKTQYMKWSLQRAFELTVPHCS